MPSRLKSWLRLYFVRLANVAIKECYPLIEQAEQTAINESNQLILSQLKTCGKAVGLWGKVHLTGAGQMEIGDNVHIGDNAFIRAEGGLYIGDNTHISRNLVLYTINHQYAGTRIPYDEQYIKKPVRIGKNVWIGMNVCITPGTVIGDGAIIGMGTTLSGSIPPLSIVGSQKWRTLAYRDKEHYDRLEEIGAFGGISGRPLSQSDRETY
jgi:acetyltransferase-like isoleucine patch superfamily enzyme